MYCVAEMKDTIQFYELVSDSIDILSIRMYNCIDIVMWNV